MSNPYLQSHNAVSCLVDIHSSALQAYERLIADLRKELATKDARIAELEAQIAKEKTNV